MDSRKPKASGRNGGSQARRKPKRDSHGDGGELRGKSDTIAESASRRVDKSAAANGFGESGYIKRGKYSPSHVPRRSMNQRVRNKGIDAVKSADRVLDLFELLSGWGHEISHSEIATALAIPKGSLTKLLQNLIARGYVDYSPISKGYRLGHIFGRLAEQTSQSRSLVTLIGPILQDLTAQTNESSTLNQLRGFQSVVIATVSSPMRLVPHMRVGDVGPLYALSGGKCMLAAMPDAMINEYMSQVVFEPITPKTISSTADLWREIAEVRRTGVAFSLEEYTPGISGIGVAVLSETGFPLGSLTLAIPTVRFTPEAKERGIRVLKAAADRIREQHLTRLASTEHAPAPEPTPPRDPEMRSHEKAPRSRKVSKAVKPAGARTSTRTIVR